MSCIIFQTSLGWMGIAGTASGLQRVILPRSTKMEVEQALYGRIQKIEDRRQKPCHTPDFSLLSPDSSLLPRDLYDVVKRIKRYLEGNDVSFRDSVDLSGATEFQKEVWLALRDIPFGQTVNYSELAARLGRPGAARAVGQALSRNPLPIVLPCHRVIGRSGGLVGFNGGIVLKKLLIDLETRRKRWKKSI